MGGLRQCNGRGGSPFEWRVRVVVWIEQTAQLGIPRLRRSVEPAVERFLRVEDDGLSVVQPREAAARSRRHDREGPERFGLACVTTTSQHRENPRRRSNEARYLHTSNIL